MQTIQGNTTELGLEAKSIELTFTIVNRFLKPITIKDKDNNASPILITKTTSDKLGNFTLNLWENDAGERFSLYLITTTENKTLKQYIYIPFISIAIAHISILKQPLGCEGILTFIQARERVYSFNDKLFKELDSYMLNQNTQVSDSTKKIFEKLCNYADQSNPTKKSDSMKTLDIKLGEINEFN